MFSITKLDYCKDYFASMSNNEDPVSDPEQQALAADPDPTK
jgi:hypothetical protein